MNNVSSETEECIIYPKITNIQLDKKNKETLCQGWISLITIATPLSEPNSGIHKNTTLIIEQYTIKKNHTKI